MGKKIIAIEGRGDDGNFIREVFKVLEIDCSNFQFEDLSGQGDFDTQLKLIVQGLNRGDSLAFIRDAELNQSQTHLKNFKKLLEKVLPERKRNVLNIEIPNKLSVFENCQTRVGIHLMPGEGQKGCIEDLCIRLLKKEATQECVTQFFECIQKDRQIKRHFSKKEFFLRLAISLTSTDGEFAYSPGTAAQKDYLNFKQRNIPELESLKNFLTEFAK